MCTKFWQCHKQMFIQKKTKQQTNISACSSSLSLIGRSVWTTNILPIHTHTQMSKTIGKLEKEMLMWKSRYEKCNRSLLEMAEEVRSVSFGHYPDSCVGWSLATRVNRCMYMSLSSCLPPTALNEWEDTPDTEGQEWEAGEALPCTAIREKWTWKETKNGTLEGKGG